MSNASIRHESDGVDRDLDRERAFLRYRRAVVSRWPEEAAKTATLSAIEARLRVLQPASGR